MAAPRWRLINAHYINVIVDGQRSGWEYQEQSRQTGRMIRKKYDVPMLLEPKDQADHNYPELGLIIVCRGEPDRGYERDFQFFGEPTPDMEPMNEEAQAITDSLKGKWAHPIEGLSSNYGDVILQTFEQQLRDAMARGVSQGQAQPQQAQSVGPDIAAQLKAMQDRMAALEQENLKLQAGKIDPMAEFEPLEDLPVDPPPPVIKGPLRQAQRGR